MKTLVVTSEEIYALAVELEGEEIPEDHPLGADDIFPLLESLWERGYLRPAPEITLPENGELSA